VADEGRPGYGEAGGGSAGKSTREIGEETDGREGGADGFKCRWMEKIKGDRQRRGEIVELDFLEESRKRRADGDVAGCEREAS
jgi:hypothetical protein